VLLKKSPDFLLECHFTVMDFLIDDIGNDGALVRFADRKGTVAGLPTEIAVAFFPDHFRRARFDVFNEIGQRNCPGEAEEQMHVVGYATDLDGLAILTLQRTRQIGVHLRSQLWGL